MTDDLFAPIYAEHPDLVEKVEDAPRLHGGHVFGVRLSVSYAASSVKITTAGATPKRIGGPVVPSPGCTYSVASPSV